MSTADGPDLDRLREAAVTGETGAMEDLLRALQPLVSRRCAAILACRADVEEATQDALLAVATHLDDYAGRGSFTGWVAVIAANSARATYRSLRRRFDESTRADPPERADPRTTSVIAGTRLDLLDAIEALEQRHPELVAPLVLRDLAGLSYAEVAAHTGAPLGTVKARVHEGRSYVRRRLVP